MPELKDTPMVVFGNKCDRKEALQEQDFREAMGLQFHLTKGKDSGSLNPSAAHNLEVFMISVKGRAGYSDGFTWLSGQLAWVSECPGKLVKTFVSNEKLEPALFLSS